MEALEEIFYTSGVLKIFSETTWITDEFGENTHYAFMHLSRYSALKLKGFQNNF